MLWFDKHRKVASMDSLLKTVTRQPLRNYRIEPDNAKFLPPLVLVCMVKGWLFLRTGPKI